MFRFAPAPRGHLDAAIQMVAFDSCRGRLMAGARNLSPNGYKGSPRPLSADGWQRFPSFRAGASRPLEVEQASPVDCVGRTTGASLRQILT
jgi:hypothetical protein